jgi:hypothetical protein
MTPSYALLLVLVSLAFTLVVSRFEKFSQGAGIVAWLAVVGAFVALQQGLWSSASAIVLSVGFASMAAFPIVPNAAIRKRAVWALPVILCPLVFLGGDLPLVDGHFVLLVVAALAATLAGLSLVLGAAFLRSPRGLMPIIASTVGGVALLGFKRSPLATGFQLPLVGPDGPVYWELASAEGFPEGLRLLATTTSPSFVGYLAVFGGLLLLVIVLILLTRDPAKLKKIEPFTKVVLIVFATMSFFQPRASELPDAQPYSDFTRLALQTRQIDPIMAESAHFLQTGGLKVDIMAMSLDLFLLFFGVALLGFAGWQIRKDHPVCATASRDLFARGVAFLWLGWFLTMLFQASLMGSLGLHSPGEWIHLGLVTLSTALLLLGWRHSTQVGSHFAAWSPGILVAAWVLFAAVAWSYRAILGFSVTLG